ncbi:hypothetical protein GCM10010388_28860 [Streptomyces mauvecolor]
MHLRDAEVLGDPALGHVPEEPHVEDLPFALGQAAQAGLDRLAVDHGVEGRVGAAQGVAQGVSVLAAREFGVEGERAEAVDGLKAGLDLFLGHPGVRGELRHGRPGGPGARREFLARDPHPAPQVLDAARHMERPHVVAEVALDLARDCRHGVALERGAAGGVVPVDGLDQAEGRDLTEVLKGLAPVAETSR